MGIKNDLQKKILCKKKHLDKQHLKKYNKNTKVNVLNLFLMEILIFLLQILFVLINGT